MDIPNSDLKGPKRGPAPTKHVDILWAAVSLFAKQGVAETTTKQIAAAASTTERTLFKHYGSKDGLVQAVIKQAVLAQMTPASLSDLQGHIEEGAAPDSDLESWHRALLKVRSTTMGAAPELARLLLLEIIRDDELRTQFGQQWLGSAWRPLVTVLRGLQKAGKLREDIEVDAMAQSFFSLNLGYLIARHVLCPSLKWDDQSAQHSIAAIFAKGVARR